MTRQGRPAGLAAGAAALVLAAAGLVQMGAGLVLGWGLETAVMAPFGAAFLWLAGGLAAGLRWARPAALGVVTVCFAAALADLAGGSLPGMLTAALAGLDLAALGLLALMGRVAPES